MSDTPTLLTARTEPDQLQVDAWSNEPLLVSLEMGGRTGPVPAAVAIAAPAWASCKAGKVRYDETFTGLSPEELALGYVLPALDAGGGQQGL